MGRLCGAIGCGTLHWVADAPEATGEGARPANDVPPTHWRDVDGVRTTGRDRAQDQPTRIGMHELRRSRDPWRAPWALNDDAAQQFFQQAVELGITFWDTANTYQNGTSEELVGRAITRYSRREDIVLATKVFGRMHDGPGGQGLSRKAILEQVDASLARLGTDYIDLYQIHRFDPDAPVEETMEALHDIVKAGKVRYLGASSMYVWQFAKLRHAAALHGWMPFVSMQNQYNLLRRQDEPELMAMCADMGVGVVPYSPQGKGRLARPWGQQSHRSCPRPSRRFTCASVTTRSGRSRSRTRHMGPPGSDELVGQRNHPLVIKTTRAAGTERFACGSVGAGSRRRSQ
jgi:aryl-alcohol dehydrogenase-like predicted oxidoreductase